MINELFFTPGIHESSALAVFDGAVKYSGDPIYPFPLYLIGFTNRSGSNLIAEHLQSTGQFSGLQERFNWDAMPIDAAEFGAKSFPEFVTMIVDRGLVPGTVYGFKAGWDQIAMLLRWRIDTMFSGGVRVIHTIRRDLLEQAVSFSIADQTKRWTSLVEGEPDASPVFRFEDIEGRVAGAAQANQLIAYLCSLFEIPRLEAYYEEFAADPIPSIHRIGEFAGLDLSQWVPTETRLKKQADDTNIQFIERFRKATRQQILDVASQYRA
ncbi:Stf0 family sulfotransferase [Mesorhizobium sp. ANAO-SY3R2]|uniref:Stf0 family sulfotransferase n=1 Tax=Mesorhizobium sp. ANAO-SY3R2 TaxID=3166644 RepID=UPI00366DE256